MPPSGMRTETGSTCIAEDDASLFEHLGLVIVIDPKLGKQDLVLVGSESSFQTLSLLLWHPYPQVGPMTRKWCCKDC